MPIPQVTTCRTTPATWSEYVASENTIMFRHLMGNDPRPHFMHQSNLADYNPALPETDPGQGGILYPVVDGLLARYDAAIDRANAPLVQLTSAQVAATLARQNAWAAHLAAGDVTAWLQDGKLHVKNASGGRGRGAADRHDRRRPLRRAALRLEDDRRRGRAGARPTSRSTPRPTVRARAGGDADGGHGPGRDAADRLRLPVAALRRGLREHRRRDRRAYRSRRPTAARSCASSSQRQLGPSVSQAASATTGARAEALDRARPGRRPSKPSRLTLTKLKMSPQRFAVSHPQAPRHAPGRLADHVEAEQGGDGAAHLPAPQVGAKKHRRWVTVGTIRRSAPKGTGVVRFTGRFKAKPLAPRAYRLTVTATAGREKAAPKRVSFRVVKG